MCSLTFYLLNAFQLIFLCSLSVVVGVVVVNFFHFHQLLQNHLANFIKLGTNHHWGKEKLRATPSLKARQLRIIEHLLIFFYICTQKLFGLRAYELITTPYPNVLSTIHHLFGNHVIFLQRIRLIRRMK